MYNQQFYEIAIGQKISELLNLKVNKIGRFNTSIGDKSMQGLGACLIEIIERENNRQRIDIILADLKENYDMGIYTVGEYNALVLAVK